MKARAIVIRGEERARYVTPDLSYYWEGAREHCEDNKRDEGKKKKTPFWGGRTARKLYTITPAVVKGLLIRQQLLGQMLTDFSMYVH